MSTKGRHSGDNGSFYRDLAIMVGGILVVGLLVFFVLFLLARDTTSETTTTTSTTTTTTTTTLPQTSTSEETSSSSSSTSTTVPVRPNEDVRVAVLNSVGIAGSAGRFTQVLADEGLSLIHI